MSDARPPEDWESRRARLAERLDERRARERADEADGITKRSGMQGMAQGLKIASEFVAGVAVGALLGYGIDHFLGTRPFGLIIFLLLGFGAGVRNVIRGASTSQESGPNP